MNRGLMKKLFTRLALVFCVLLQSAGMGSDSDVSVDLYGPSSGVFEGKWPAVSRVQICVAGPTKGIESYTNIKSLLSRPPVYVTTNSLEIEQLLSALTEHNFQVLGNDAVGYTHHVFLFEDQGDKVMQFRVFTADLSTNGPLAVYPRTDTHFGYASDKIIPWLRSHYGTNTAYKAFMEKHPL